MTFSDPRWLWGLAAVPPLALLHWLVLRRAAERLVRLVGGRVPHPLLAQRAPSRRRLGAALVLGAVASLFVGAAGPEWGHEVVRRSASGSDLVFLIDVSASMDSRDVPPSRLDESRREALAVLDRVAGTRVGVVAFAGDAVRLCPLTLDHGAARLVVESLSSGSVSEPGSDLGRALRMAARVMPGGRREEQAILLWTDGEDLEQGARDAIEPVARSGIRVFAIGVGTRAGDVVPVLDDQGRATDVKRDDKGLAVRSRLDEELLRHLAQRTHGIYLAANRPGGELPRLLGAVGGLARSSRGMRLAEHPVARFPLFAALAAALLLLELAWGAPSAGPRPPRWCSPSRSCPRAGPRRRPRGRAATAPSARAVMPRPSRSTRSGSSTVRPTKCGSIAPPLARCAGPAPRRRTPRPSSAGSRPVPAAWGSPPATTSARCSAGETSMSPRSRRSGRCWSAIRATPTRAGITS